MDFQNLLTENPTFRYGPYFHKINKGGLIAILESGRLRPTEARAIAGGATAVRASRTWEPSDSFNGAVLEFYAEAAPRTGTAQWLAEWRMPEYETLRIQVVKVHGTPRPEDL